MRVLLINPKSSLPIETRTSPPLGLAYLAAVSEQAGHQVRVHDGDVEEMPLEAALREFEPHIVGITANTTQITAAWRDAAIVKQVSGAPVVLGGPHPTVLPDESAAKPFVDAVVRGEGEATWIEILSRLERDGPAAPLDDLSGMLTTLPAARRNVTPKIPSHSLSAVAPSA